MSDLPNPNNGYVATLDYELSLANLNAILGGMWQELQPYRDIVSEADTAINDLNARTLQVIGESITPELDQARADVQAAVDDIQTLQADADTQIGALISQAEADIAAVLESARLPGAAERYFMATI